MVTVGVSVGVWGTVGVSVGVWVTVGVPVGVPVGVDVWVGVSVGVCVGVSVGVTVGVFVGVGVGSQSVVNSKAISQEVPRGSSIGSPETNVDPGIGSVGEKMRTASSLK